MYIINHVPYALHHNSLLNANHTQGKNFLKKTHLENKKMVFKNGVKAIEVACVRYKFSISTQISSRTNERTCQ